MEFGQEFMDSVPIVLDGHPGRPGFRARQISEHRPGRPLYYPTYNAGSNGLLVPATGGGRIRAHSAGGQRPMPAVIINNQAFDERRKSQDFEFDDDDWDQRAHSPRRERSRSRSRVRPRARRDGSRDASPYRDYETEKRLRRLEDLERKEDEEEREKRIKERLLLKEAKEEAEARKKKKEEEELTKIAIEKHERKQREKEAEAKKRKKEEEELKKIAIEEHHRKQWEKEEKEKREKKEAEEAYRARVKRDFEAAGYSDEHIEAILSKDKKDKHPKVLDLVRPTFIKVHRKHMHPDTLDLYQLPWEWDERDSNYIIIKRWVPEHEQDVLFEHSRRLKDTKRIEDTTTLLKKEQGRLLLVREREKKRPRSWFLT